MFDIIVDHGCCQALVFIRRNRGADLIDIEQNLVQIEVNIWDFCPFWVGKGGFHFQLLFI